MVIVGVAGDGVADERRPAATSWPRAPGCKAERLELGGDVAGGDVEAARARLAALEQIVGEEGDMGAEGVGAERRQRRRRRYRLRHARRGHGGYGQPGQQGFDLHGKRSPLGKNAVALD